VALRLISPVIPETLQMFLWGALLIICSIYLSALDPLPRPSNGFAKFQKGVGIIALILGTSLLIGALMGGRDLLQPLSGINQGSRDQKPLSYHGSGLAFERITDLNQLDAYLKKSRGLPVMLHVSADWCTACKEMEEFTFTDPRVIKKLEGIKLLMADVTVSSEETIAFLKKFSLFGPPAVLFFDKEGREIPGTRVIGFQNAGEFLKTLDLAFEKN